MPTLSPQKQYLIPLGIVSDIFAGSATPSLKLFSQSPLWQFETFQEMLLSFLCVALAGLSNALSLKPKILPRQDSTAPADVPNTASASIPGVATFVDFVYEPNTLCGPLSGTHIKAIQWSCAQAKTLSTMETECL